MSFISVSRIVYEKDVHQYIHTIIDDELGEIKVRISTTAGGGMISVMVGVVKAYSDRNLNVGKNLALATIYWHKTYIYSLQQVIEWEDEHCPKVFDNETNWSQYAKERDEYLAKILPLL